MTDPTPDLSVPDPVRPDPTLPHSQPVKPKSTTLWLRVKGVAWKVAPWVERARTILRLVRR